MASSKCLDLYHFEMFSCILFRSKYSKILKNIFDKSDSEPIVTLGYKAVMTSSECLFLNFFEFFSCTIYRSSTFQGD